MTGDMLVRSSQTGVSSDNGGKGEGARRVSTGQSVRVFLTRYKLSEPSYAKLRKTGMS